MKLHDDVYDLETYPNCFLAGFLPTDGEKGVMFEISTRRNDADALYAYVRGCRRMIGFNNLGFDWPIMALFMRMYENNQPISPVPFYNKTNEIIKGDAFDHTIWNPEIEQLDLYRIHHLDNKARRTGLKKLEFVMRSENIEDLPFPPGTMLTHQQMDVLKYYGCHDITETAKFFKLSAEEIAFREEIGNPRAFCWSDAKIGKQFFIDELHKVGVETRNPDGTPRQTLRPEGVRLADVIFPYVGFHSVELNGTLDFFRLQTVFNTKGTLKTSVKIGGLDIDLGLGGIHGSRSWKIVEAGDKYLLDIDVTGFYPNLAIANEVYPEHLGPAFVDVYERVRDRRKDHAKGTSTNKALKLAGNAVYGDSNNPHGVFMDPAYMLTITINGQLLQCMLAEWLCFDPEVELIQINTDGMTIRFPDSSRAHVENAVETWEAFTRLNLEAVLYNRMFIRDVNNYIAEGVDGKVKRKGAYEYKREWWQDHSALVVQKAVEAFLLHDTDPMEFLESHDDPWDFLLCAKVNRDSRLELGVTRAPLQNTTRYYVSTIGDQLVKVMPPLKGKVDERRIGIHAEGQAECLGDRKNYRCSICGETFELKKMFDIHNKEQHAWKITPCNHFDGSVENVDYRFYLREIDKLTLDFRMM